MGKKKKIWSMLLAVVLLSSCGCGTKEENLGDTYIMGKDNPFYFSNYNPGVLAESEDAYYFIGTYYLMSMDKETREITPVCNKPDCLHDAETDASRVAACNARVASDGDEICYYDGKLYVLTQALDTLGITKVIYEVDVSGSTRKEIYRAEDYVLAFMIHRGKLYLSFSDFMQGDEYYEKNPEIKAESRYWVEQYDLAHMSRKPKIIYEKQGDIGQITGMWAYGNQIYLNIIGGKAGGTKVSCDLQKKTTTEFPTESSVAVLNQQLVYFEKQEGTDKLDMEELYKRYEGKKAVLADLKGKPEGELNIPFVPMMYSNDSILALDNYNAVAFEIIPKSERAVRFYDKGGKFLCEVPLGEDAIADSIGMDEDYYFYRMKPSTKTDEQENASSYEIWAVDLHRLGEPDLKGEPFICYVSPVQEPGVWIE